MFHTGTSVDLQDLISDCAERQSRWGVFDPESYTLEERASFVRTMSFALTDEIHELVNTIQWKPWATSPGSNNDSRARQLDEAADVLFFLGNLFVAFGFTSYELKSALQGKRDVIEGRHDSKEYRG